MTQVTRLYDMARRAGIPVDCMEFLGTPSLSIHTGGRCYIAIDPMQLESTADEKVKLAHELGHCKTLSFYNSWSPADLRGRHEERANRWAIRQLVPRRALSQALAGGVTELWDLAEHFQVTEPFMRKALEYYRTLEMA